MSDLPPIPLIVRTRLAHATLQAIADACGADLLHIKGAAVDPSLLPTRPDAPADATVEQRALPRLSADADVLVRPAHLKRYQAALKRFGWQRKTRLYSGGAVEHSEDWWHPELGSADVHIRFPGIRIAPERAFTDLWRERQSKGIAGRQCPGPDVDAQRLLLLLHAARNGGPASADVGPTWTSATVAQKARARDLAFAFGAEVALAGSTGHLGDYADRAEYDLWRLLGEPDADVFNLWLAFVKAAPTVLDRVRAILYAVRFKADRLELALKRTATPLELLRVQTHRIRRGAAGLMIVTRRSIASFPGRGLGVASPSQSGATPNQRLAILFKQWTRRLHNGGNVENTKAGTGTYRGKPGDPIPSPTHLQPNARREQVARREKQRYQFRSLPNPKDHHRSRWQQQ